MTKNSGAIKVNTECINSDSAQLNEQSTFQITINESTTTNTSHQPKARIDYIDLLKGITILWLIWVHTDSFGFRSYQNPIFFFASGIFFKLSDFKSFFSHRLRNIIVPILFFYIASIPIRYIVDLWDYRTFDSFDWNRVLDIFRIEPHPEYLSLDVPLWFPLALFVIHSFSFLLFRFNKKIILALAILALLFYNELYQIPTPFMLNNAMACFGYFTIGYLIGKPIIKYLTTIKSKVIVTVIFFSIFIVSLGLDLNNPGMIHGLVEKFEKLSFCIFFMAFFSFFNGIKQLELIRFFGKNSFSVLGAHLWFIIPIQRIVFKLTNSHDPWIGLGIALMTALLLIPLILWMNKRIPRFVGYRP